MSNPFSRLSGAALLLVAAAAAQAAPLDALLSADQYHRAGELRLEASVDAMNSTLDVFRVRAQDPLFAGTNVGDYLGAHARVGYALTNRVALEGALWQRKVAYRSDDMALGSWQLAGQIRLWGNEKSRTHYALRLSAWGNEAGSLTKSTPTTVGGRTVNSVTIDSPSDRQLQIDGLGSWRLAPQITASAFAGLGRSTVSTGDMRANYTSGIGCNYNLTFTPTAVSGVLAVPCASTALFVSAFSSPQQILQELSYSASYYQLGGMLQWQSATWALRGGYQYQHLQRSDVDALVASRGGQAYQTNHVLAGELTRVLTPNVAVFVRGQAMSNQFVGEIPFSYNAVTASKFGGKYGLVSFGAMMRF